MYAYDRNANANQTAWFRLQLADCVEVCYLLCVKLAFKCFRRVRGCSLQSAKEPVAVGWLGNWLIPQLSPLRLKTKHSWSLQY